MDPIKDITADYVRKIFSYDPETGIFIRRMAVGRHSRFPAGSVVGSMDVAGYMVTTINAKRVYLHRVAVLYMTGAWPVSDVDHKDCDRSNNKWANLRCASRMVNTQNRRKSRSDRIHGTLLGVKKHRKRWQARIAANGQHTFLGSFATEQEAHDAYVTAKRQLHDGCTL